MADLPPLPTPAQLLALAHTALLDQLDRADPAHALTSLLADLALATGRRVWLDDTTAAQAELAADGTLCLPLRRLDVALGTLCLQPGADLPPAPTALALGDVVATVAALRQRQLPAPCLPDGGRPADQATGGALIRAALRGAGTFVWEWHIPSDRLGDIDEGFTQLGHPPSQQRRNQADWDALIHPDDRAGNHTAYLRHAGGETAVYEHIYRARAADNSWHWLHERGRIVEWQADGSPLRMVGVQSDITEQRRAESAANAATLRLGKIAAHVPGVVFQYQMDNTGFARFPYISDRCLALFGALPEDLARDASNLLRRVNPAQRAQVLAAIVASARSLQPWVSEFEVRRPDGVVQWVRGSATPQREADGQMMWHGHFENVTDWRVLAQAAEGKRLAEAANRSKTEFLSRMSHELRTPLNAVLGFAQLMALDTRTPLAAAQQRWLGLIRQSGEHLLGMIDDLLDLTSIEAGRLALALDVVDVLPLARDAVAMVQAATLQHHITLHCQASGPVQAWADPKRLRQVLINLLSNAVKYNRPGGQVLLHLAQADGQTTLAVQDTGIGLDSADLAALFEPFNRLGQAHGPIEGTGIGLAVTQGLVQMMGGRITVQSTLGVGSCFTVTLPSRG